jgi:hypothetical protein
MLVMLIVTGLGALYLTRTAMGRHIDAVGGNVEASRYSGLCAPGQPQAPVRRLVDLPGPRRRRPGEGGVATKRQRGWAA